VSNKKSEYLLAYAPVRKPRARKVKEIPDTEPVDLNEVIKAATTGVIESLGGSVTVTGDGKMYVHNLTEGSWTVERVT
jgi:hypothetical protein